MSADDPLYFQYMSETRSGDGEADSDSAGDSSGDGEEIGDSADDQSEASTEDDTEEERDEERGGDEEITSRGSEGRTARHRRSRSPTMSLSYQDRHPDKGMGSDGEDEGQDHELAPCAFNCCAGVDQGTKPAAQVSLEEGDAPARKK